MADIREIALRVIAGKAQEGDALAMAEYIERNELAFKQQSTERLNALNELFSKAPKWSDVKPKPKLHTDYDGFYNALDDISRSEDDN